jgi:hypothetical protein
LLRRCKYELSEIFVLRQEDPMFGTRYLYDAPIDATELGSLDRTHIVAQSSQLCHEPGVAALVGKELHERRGDSAE